MREEDENGNTDASKGVNDGASTSAADSCFFEASSNMLTNSECQVSDTDDD